MATIYCSQFKIGYKFNILTDREADTQVPDKQCHCGIFFTHSQAFNSHLDTDHQPEEGYPNGKWPCNEEPSYSKEYHEKGKVWRHIRQKHRNIHSNQFLLCPFGHDEEYGILKHLITKHNEWNPQCGVVGVIFYLPRKTQK